MLLKFQKKNTVSAALHYTYIYIYTHTHTHTHTYTHTCTWKVNILNEKSVEKDYLASLQDLKNLVPILPAKKFLRLIPAHSLSQTPTFKNVQHFRTNMKLLP